MAVPQCMGMPLILSASSLFKDAFQVPKLPSLGCRMVMNDKLLEIQKQAVVAYLGY